MLVGMIEAVLMSDISATSVGHGIRLEAGGGVEKLVRLKGRQFLAVRG